MLGVYHNTKLELLEEGSLSQAVSVGMQRVEGSDLLLSPKRRLSLSTG